MDPRSPLVFDHIAVACRTLAEGTTHIQQQIGLTIPAGGAHPIMGTHNRLMALSDTEFLEAIAVDPGAPAPARARWYALDSFHDEPRIATWVLGTRDLRGALDVLQKRLPHVDLGVPLQVMRDQLMWHLSVPEDGAMPFDGAFPALIEWSDSVHPAGRMADLNAQLHSMNIVHPQGDVIRQALGDLFPDDRFTIAKGDALSIEAQIETPDGMRTLT